MKIINKMVLANYIKQKVLVLLLVSIPFITNAQLFLKPNFGTQFIGFAKMAKSEKQKDFKHNPLSMEFKLGIALQYIINSKSSIELEVSYMQLGDKQTINTLKSRSYDDTLTDVFRSIHLTAIGVPNYNIFYKQKIAQRPHYNYYTSIGYGFINNPPQSFYKQVLFDIVNMVVSFKMLIIIQILKEQECTMDIC